MYFLKNEQGQIRKLKKVNEEYIKIDELNDLSKILTLKDKDYIIGSHSEFMIDNCYELITFLAFYKRIKLNLVKEMDNYNSKLDNEDNIYIKELLSYFKDLNSDGKFIRGFLIVLGYLLMNKQGYEEAIPLALAFELFQTSVLIHDDIIDNATLRRGKKTVATRYRDKYTNASHLGNSLAICAGDIGFYKANEILIDNYSGNKDLLKYFNTVIINTIRGETLDVVLPHLRKHGYFEDEKLEHHVMDIYRLKTSWYSIVGPICLGMILGGAHSSQVKLMEDFAYGLGIAFQIKDDILGIYSNKVKAEKTSSDISEFKQTILYSYVYENHPTYLDELHKYYGHEDLNVDDLEKVKSIFEKSGALKYANDMMTKFFMMANQKLEKMSFITNDDKTILKGFIIYLEQRDH